MKKILVPTDFSKVAQMAVNVAADIARKAEARLILLHVIEQPGSDSFRVTGEMSASTNWEEKLYTLKLIEKSKSQLAKEIELLKEKGVKVTPEIRLGNPYHGITTVITEQNVDLVVMGTSGRSKLEEMIIGSNTEKVIRHAHCPVLTVHGKPGNTDYKNIVYATSLSDSEKDFAKLVKNTQKIYDSTVHVLRINTPNNFQPDYTVDVIMQDFVKKIKLDNYTLNVYNDYSEEEGIIHFAESIDADLIVMATHGRKGFAHVLVGSIAEDVANHSKRPVLTYITK
ncbi:MAG TPA: universal stress protein [Chryseosolibacter sp.]|nr:universal stress protein [Chryseosolibacter sp.]